MFRIPSVLRRAAGLAAGAVYRNRSSSFQPFSQRDEEDLVRVIKTKPRHVLRHVRQRVWRSRKRELHFRNTVTHLMIILQEYLRKQLIEPSDASRIMEGVLQECVTYGQHDMAHLLFRAFLRFRKYGCTISVDAIRYLFESYRENDSTDLMLQLAGEMKGDEALRSLCIAAYLFAGHESDADALREGLRFEDLTKDDVLALIIGYDKLQKTDSMLDIATKVSVPGRLSPVELDEVYRALLRAFYRKDDDASFTQVLQCAVDAKAALSGETFAVVLRHKTRHAASMEDIAVIEAELAQLGYTADATGNSILISAYARLHHFGDRGSEELMLSKVDTLLSSIVARLKQGDADMDVSAAHIRAVLRGYGAAGRADAMKQAWAAMRCDGVSNDVRVYNELFKWFALMGNVKDVLALKEEMERLGVHPDAVTYTWILRALGKYYPRHVEELYKELVDRRVRPDIHLFNTLIGILSDLGLEDNVHAIVEEMRKREDSGTLQLNAITYAVLIRVQARDLAKVTVLYNEAKQRGLADHPHVQTSMLHTLASHEGSAAQLESFLAEQTAWSTDVYNVLLHMYAKANNKAQFDELLTKMKADSVAMSDVTFGTLITAYARWGDAEGVNGVIQILKDHEGEVSAAFYSVLASSLNRLGNAAGVSDAWEDLLASKLFPNTEVYNQFLLLYSRQHNVTRMQDVLDSMMKQVPPNPVTATTVLDMLGKSGRVGEMESLFEDMKAVPDTTPTSVTYHQMMNAYAKTGDVVKMERIHEEFLVKGYANNAVTYNILMDGHGRARNYEQMEEIAKKRKEDGVPLDDLAYCIMITTYGKAKMEDQVQRLFNDVHTSASADVAESRRVLWSFVDAFCRCGNADYVEKCVDALRQKSPEQQLHHGDCVRLIPFYSRLGRMDAVEQLAKRITDATGELGYTTINTIARGYARAGRFDKVVEALHQLRDRNWVPDASTALNLSGAFLKAGLHEQAKQVIQWRRKYATFAGVDEAPSESRI